MSADNMLKGFGIGADVAGQLATAVALRRKSSSSSTEGIADSVESVNGELAMLEGVVADMAGEVQSVTLTNAAGQTFTHSLGRVPAGVILLQAKFLTAFACTDVSDTEVTIHSSVATDAVIWIV